MLGVPVAICSSQIFGPVPLSLMHCTLQLPRPGMAPVQLMLHFLNSNTAGMLSVGARLVPMHTRCSGILSAHAYSVPTQCLGIISAHAYSVPMFVAHIYSGFMHTLCPCLLSAHVVPMLTRCSCTLSAHANSRPTHALLPCILSAQVDSVLRHSQGHACSGPMHSQC